MRITVIATGIEEEKKQSVPKQSSSNVSKITPRQMPQGDSQEILRTKANSIDHEDLNIPAYLRQRNKQHRQGTPSFESTKRTTGMSSNPTPTPGSEDFIFDEEESEIPAFIRMQAD